MNTPTQPRDEEPTTKTRTILAAIHALEGKLDTFKDVPEEVQKLRETIAMLKEQEARRKHEQDTWRAGLFRILTSALSLLFPDKMDHRDSHKK